MKKLVNSLPPIKGELPPPTEQELDAAVVRWNSYCPPFFIGLLQADSETDKTSKSKFVRSADGLRIYLRKGHRLITRKEISAAYIAYTKKASGL